MEIETLEPGSEERVTRSYPVDIGARMLRHAQLLYERWQAQPASSERQRHYTQYLDNLETMRTLSAEFNRLVALNE
jgi:hypothetical protein